LHLFPHHFSRSGGFCENPLRSFEVFTALEVAPLGVSVLPLHASLSACNRDMSLSCSSVWAVEQGHSQPYHQSPNGTTSDQGFDCTTFSERSFVHNFKCFQKYKHFAIHLLPEGRSFLAYLFVMDSAMSAQILHHCSVLDVRVEAYKGYRARKEHFIIRKDR
jgi:hypothetical protein